MSLFSQPSVQWSPVFLISSTTWDAWFALNKNMATVQGIWQYTNPDTPTAELPALHEPVAPAVPQMVDDAQNPVNFYRIQYQVYMTEME
jgi:hypothetical protein